MGVLEHTQPNTHPPIGAAFARPPPSRHPTSGDRLIARSVRKHRPSAKKGIRHGFECIIRSPWFKPWPWLRTLYSPSHLGLTTVILKFTSLYYLTGPSAVVLFLAGHLIQPLEFWERITSARVSRRLYHSSSNPTRTFGIIYTIPVAMATPSNVAVLSTLHSKEAALQVWLPYEPYRWVFSEPGESFLNSTANAEG